MTFWATRSQGDPQNIDVQVTHGPVTIKVTENYLHLKNFADELGKLVSQAKAEVETQVRA